ncbi:MAG: hypothetical protein JSS79_07785 [Bacteroidetes bacterium]|nr:hypothetical protein [Bacteroidota bacterium]
MEKTNQKNVPQTELENSNEDQKLELFQVEELEERFELATWIGTLNGGCNSSCGAS